VTLFAMFISSFFLSLLKKTNTKRICEEKKTWRIVVVCQEMCIGVCLDEMILTG
jgi:hypothetical protein